MSARKPADVSRVLKAAGIPVGYRYTQTGYVDRDRVRVTVPGCEVTRNKRSRYGGDEDLGYVGVYVIDPNKNDLVAGDDFQAGVVKALRDAGYSLGKTTMGSIQVLDPEPSAEEIVEGVLLDFGPGHAGDGKAARIVEALRTAGLLAGS